MVEREKEVIVTNGDGGGGSGVLIAVVLLVLVVGVLFYLFGQGMLGGGDKDINADIKIETPAKTN